MKNDSPNPNTSKTFLITFAAFQGGKEAIYDQIKTVIAQEIDLSGPDRGRSGRSCVGKHCLHFEL
jgi:hypothetical protein